LRASQIASFLTQALACGELTVVSLQEKACGDWPTGQRPVDHQFNRPKRAWASGPQNRLWSGRSLDLGSGGRYCFHFSRTSTISTSPTLQTRRRASLRRARLTAAPASRLNGPKAWTSPTTVAATGYSSVSVASFRGRQSAIYCRFMAPARHQPWLRSRSLFRKPVRASPRASQKCRVTVEFSRRRHASTSPGRGSLRHEGRKPTDLP
jgi:hypothetical protein